MSEPLEQNLEQPSTATTSGDTSVPAESRDTSAPAESRDTSAPAESRDTNAPAESRDTSAPAESRDTNAPAESRDTNAPAESRDILLPPPELEPTGGQEPVVTGVPSIKTVEEATRALTQSAPADGIEILVKLAESGEIDPKNVDIIDVTDKFLRAVAAAPKENLRQSGRILFHACVLLRMKAEALLVDNSAFDGGDDFLEFDEDGGALIYDSNRQAVGRQITLHDLERALVRKANNRQSRQRKVTLDQLIEALREAERIEKQRAEKKPRARIELAGQHEVNDVDDILDLAHDEDVETTIERVEVILKNYFEIGELVALFQLIKLLDRRGDWVDAFLAVLFLSNAGTITLEQQDFWGPLYIVRADLEAEQAKLAGSA